MKEFEVIQRYFHQLERDSSVVCGVGDDAAVLQPQPGYQLVVSTDTLIEGNHFFPNTSPADLACKLLAVNLSDIAAMGAIPKWFSLGLTLPAPTESWLDEFAGALHRQCHQSAVCWVGGDLTRGDYLVMTGNIIGQVETGSAVQRSGAKPGDHIYVSGSLGDAALALQMINNRQTPPAGLRERLYRPVARVTLGRALRLLASAMIDCSDGFLQDLGHLCDQSGLGASIYMNNSILSPLFKQNSIPINWDLALSGGDDYELIFTAAAELHDEVLQQARITDTAIHHVGVMEKTPGQRLYIEGQKAEFPQRHGYDQFNGVLEK